MRRILAVLFLLWSTTVFGQAIPPNSVLTIVPPPGGGGGSSPSGANPSATAGPTAVNGSASTYMRSDGAPAVQKGSNAQFGIVEGDTTTVTCVVGVCSTTNITLGNGLSSAAGSHVTTVTNGGTVFSQFLPGTRQTGTTFTFGSGNVNGYVPFTGSSGATWTLPAAGSAGFENGNTLTGANFGTANITLSSTSTLNGITTIPPNAWFSATANTSSANCSSAPNCWDVSFNSGPVASQTGALPYSWDSNTTVANATIPLLRPPWTTSGGTITSVTYYTGGTSTPSFTVDLQIDGSDVTGCNAITVSSSTSATATCTAANTFTSTSKIQMIISGVSGTPTTALIQPNFTHTPN